MARLGALFVLLLGLGPQAVLGEPLVEVKDPAWTVRCEGRAPCELRSNGKSLLRPGRGQLHCLASKDPRLLGCSFLDHRTTTQTRAPKQGAWFVWLDTQDLVPIRIDPGHRLLALPVWEESGLRLMFRRADDSLGTRTIVPPQRPSKASPPAGSSPRLWAQSVGDPEDEPPRTLALAAVTVPAKDQSHEELWVASGHRFLLETGTALPRLADLQQASQNLISPRLADFRYEAVDHTLQSGVYLAAELPPGVSLFGAPVLAVVGGARGGRDLILLRINASASMAWWRSWGSAGEDRLLALSLLPTPPDESSKAAPGASVLGHYAGLVDLDPGPGTSLRQPDTKGQLSSQLDARGLWISTPLQEDPTNPAPTSSAAGSLHCEISERPAGSKTAAPNPELDLMLPASGEGPSVKARTLLSCASAQPGGVPFRLGLGSGLLPHSAIVFGDHLCFSAKVQGGPYDLSPEASRSTFVGVPELESVAIVACLQDKRLLRLGAPEAPGPR